MTPTAAAMLVAVALVAGGGQAARLPAGTLVLKASPIDPAAIQWITPLGNLNPPGHTLPTDHIYFYFADPNARQSPVAKRTAFMAPGDGIVAGIFNGNGAAGTEIKLFVRQTATMSYYIDHLILAADMAMGARVTAGQVLGTSGSAYAIDLGVVNDAVTRRFINPSRYNSDTLHADAPLKYFDEPLRSRLYAKVRRTGSDRDGRIDYDVDGRLAGNWFTDTGEPLAFVCDTYDPARVLIAMSGTSQGVYAIDASDPRPAAVSVASGPVTLHLSRTQSGATPSLRPAGRYMLVQMLDETHIKMDVIPTGATPAFTASARIYAR